jgi:hypothetical protein
MTAERALSDLEPFLAAMPAPAAVAIRLALKKTAPSAWSDWVRQKLLSSENADYWRAQLGPGPGSAPGAAGGGASAAPGAAGGGASAAPALEPTEADDGAKVKSFAQQTVSALALGDLERHLAGMTPMQRHCIEMSIRELPPGKWGPWVHEKLRASESPGYWAGILSKEG